MRASGRVPQDPQGKWTVRARGATAFSRRTTSACPAGSSRRSPFSKKASSTTLTSSARATSMRRSPTGRCARRSCTAPGSSDRAPRRRSGRRPSGPGRDTPAASRAAKVPVVLHAAHRDLHAIEPESSRDRQCLGPAALAERPVAPSIEEPVPSIGVSASRPAVRGHLRILFLRSRHAAQGSLVRGDERSRRATRGGSHRRRHVDGRWTGRCARATNDSVRRTSGAA